MAPPIDTMSGNIYKMSIMVVALVIGIIMVTAAIIPLVDSYTEDNTTAYNQTVGTLSKLTGDEQIEVDFTYSGKITTIGGVVVAQGNNKLVCMTDKFVIYSADSTTILWNDINNTGIGPTGDITIVIDGNDITVTDSATPTPISRTYEVSWCFVPSLDGDYSMYANGSSVGTVYLNSVDQIYGSNWATTTGKWFSFVGTNVTYDGESLEAELPLTPVSGVSDVYTAKIGGGSSAEYTFVVDNSGVDYTVHPRFYAIPYSVSGLNEDTKSNVQLIAILPMLAFVMLVVAAAAMIYSKKD